MVVFLKSASIEYSILHKIKILNSQFFLMEISIKLHST
ncbi:MAG: hypothetical protein OFPI_43500 [Osedax symbiont Rs2]|nr:MAG: hypothetical protein OFPI_43500 [Osedax symbiont Rs2]